MKHALRKSALFYILIAILIFGLTSCKSDDSDDAAATTIAGYCNISGAAATEGTLYRCFKFTGSEADYTQMAGICAANLSGTMSKTDACSTDNLVTPDGQAAGMICQDRWLSPRSAVLGTVKTDYYLYTDTTLNSGTNSAYYVDTCTGNQDSNPATPFGGTFVAP